MPLLSPAQEGHNEVYYAKKYLDINIRKKEKQQTSVRRQQKRSLKKLSRQEHKYANRLRKSDSTGYTLYNKQPLTFDSIRRIQPDAGEADPRRVSMGAKRSMDSLKGVKKFIEEKAHVTGGGHPATDGVEGKLGGLQTNLAYNNEVSRLINERTRFLSNLPSNGNKAKGLKGMQKQAFYNNEKIKAFQQIADEPSRAEEKALEYLQGTEGFEQYLTKGSGNSMNGASVEELEKMGFQTKRQMQSLLQKKVGGNLGGLQERMGGQVKDFQDKLKEVKDVKATAQQTKSSIKGLKHTDKPAFKVNPMRGLPFLKRIEQQYNWQTTRATFDGQPAIFSISYMAGFKQTPKLSYGAGIATSIGLGSNWNNIRFSFQGLGMRSYAAWQWQYGIGLYAGYERMYKQAVFVGQPEQAATGFTETPHNRKDYADAVVLGLTKAYKINSKLNGSIQLLYDIWWKEKGLRSPILIRFATMTK